MPSMLNYSISLLLVLLPLWAKSQSPPIDLHPPDTVTYKERYGLRLGADLSRLVFSAIDTDYTGFELVGDYRITQKLYIAAELGNEDKTQTEDLGGTPLYRFTTSGSYLKLGVEVNTYTNWLGMHNAITFGGRYAFARFSQTLDDYNLFESNHFFNASFLPGAAPGEEFNGLSASWLEGVAGIKVELLTNLFVGMSVRLSFLVTNKEADRFPNLWIPGFNKVTDDSNFGVGYNYSLSYLIPFYKKAKKRKENRQPPE